MQIYASCYWKRNGVHLGRAWNCIGECWLFVVTPLPGTSVSLWGWKLWWKMCSKVQTRFLPWRPGATLILSHTSWKHNLMIHSWRRTVFTWRPSQVEAIWLTCKARHPQWSGNATKRHEMSVVQGTQSGRQMSKLSWKSCNENCPKFCENPQQVVYQD